MTDADEEQGALLLQMMARVGYAVWQAAEVEDGLAHFVAIHLRSARGIGKAKGLAVLQKEQGRTFGQLYKELHDADVLPSDLDARLSLLVDDRNWLVHRAKRDSRGVLNDEARYDALMERLGAIGVEATTLNSALEREMEEFIVSSGVDRSTIDAEAAALVKQWGY